MLVKRGKEKVDYYISLIPYLAELFLRSDGNGGQIEEEQFDSLRIARSPLDSKNSLDKDKRSQSHQRAVILTCYGSFQRRQAWLQKKKSKGSSSSKPATASRQSRKRCFKTINTVVTPTNEDENPAKCRRILSSDA